AAVYVFGTLTCGTTYALGVEAFDAAGNRSSRASLSATTSPCPDSVAPTAPSNLTVTATTLTSVSLSWSASSDNVGVSGYDVFVNGSKIGSTSAAVYVFGTLTCGTSYALGVEAFDAAGNRSSRASLSAATSPCPDSVAPTAPSNLTVTATTLTSVSLSWSASSDNVGVSGYDVFLNASKIGSTSAAVYVFGTLTCGTTYALGVEALIGRAW